MKTTQLVIERQGILDRIGIADTLPRRAGESLLQLLERANPGAIRDELMAFDEAHPEAAAEMKRLRKLGYKS